MKFIYKILVLGMVCLISNATYAQIEQYSNDGTDSCIDCESKNSETSGCLCTQLFHFNAFNLAIPINNTKEEWLRGQEGLLKTAMSGLPTESFTDVQRNYFKRVETNQLALNYVSRLSASIASIENYNEATLQTSTAAVSILDIRKRNGNYGDLKFRNRYLKDITDNEVNSLYSEQLGVRNSQREAANRFGVRNSRLLRMQSDGYISNFLAGSLVVHYNHLDYEPAIRFMTTYMIRNATGVDDAPKNLTDFEGNPLVFFNEADDYSLTAEGTESQNLQTLFARTGASAQPTQVGYSPPVFGNTPSDDEVLFNYAINGFDNNNLLNFFNSQPDIRKRVKDYLGYQGYKENSLNLSESLLNAVNADTPFPHANYTYNSVTPVNFQTASNQDLAFNIKRSLTSNREYYGLAKMLEVLDRTNVKPNLVGQFIQEIASDNGINMQGILSYEDTALLFDFLIEEQYFTLREATYWVNFKDNVGSVLWANGLSFPSMLQIPYAVEGALATARGETFDFAFRKKVYDISQALNLNPAQQNELINMPTETGLIFDYLTANNSSANSIAFANEARIAYLAGEFVDLDLQIVSDGLTGKAKCLHEFLAEKGSNFIKDIMANFEGNSEFGIKIVSKQKVFGSDGKEVSGKTHPPEDGIIVIEISIDKAISRSALSVARTIIHEYIHADMFRKTNAADQQAQEVLDFRLTFDQFERTNFEPKPQHSTMALLYVNQIANTLKEFHKNVLVGDYNYLTNNGTISLDDFYQGLAWSGLRNQGVKAWTDLGDEEQQRLIDATQEYFHATTKTCPTN
ncbi:hypothetical protein [Aquimarina algiphila]|uniref:hypothetical protein n=1 Tax=Aquimarina algiphila TaxID=2047982 RepID=UPI0023302EF5|nr:hypothetical protein [Aquimarina algiphila]